MCIRDSTLVAGKEPDASRDLRIGEELAGQRFVHALAGVVTVSYTHLRAHETVLDIVCRLLLDKKQYTELKTLTDT